MGIYTLFTLTDETAAEEQSTPIPSREARDAHLANQPKKPRAKVANMSFSMRVDCTLSEELYAVVKQYAEAKNITLSHALAELAALGAKAHQNVEVQPTTKHGGKRAGAGRKKSTKQGNE